MSTTALDAEDTDEFEGPGEPSRPRILRPRNLGIVLVVTGVVGWYAAYALLIDKIRVLADPNVKLGCSINPFIDCGALFDHWQSHIFGFTNPILGVAGFIAPIIMGVGLLAGIKYPRWYFLGFNAGVFLAVAFITFLYTQSVFAIHVLCPWCLLVWAMQIAMFVLTTLYSVAEGHFGERARTGGVLRVLMNSPWIVLILWYVIIVGSIGIAFAEEWRLYLPTLFS